MNKSIAALLAAVLLVGMVSTACAAPPYDIDKVKVPIYGGETKGSIYVYRAFKGIDRYVNTDPMFTFYARYNAGQATAAEKKAFYSWPKAAQEQYLVDSKWLAGTRWRIELYGRVGERAWANKMAVAEGKEKPFEFIEREYGKDAYGWIVANKPALDAKFSAYVEGERDKLRAGLLKSDHSNWEVLRIPTYGAYVESMGVSKLEAVRKRQKSVRDRAVVEYFEYLLITDGRLYFK